MNPLSGFIMCRQLAKTQFGTDYATIYSVKNLYYSQDKVNKTTEIEGKLSILISSIIPAGCPKTPISIYLYTLSCEKIEF